MRQNSDHLLKKNGNNSVEAHGVARLFILGAVVIKVSMLLALSLIVHAFILKFIFPGYYSPLYPHHSDFYIPVALAHSLDGIFSPVSWFRHRPIGRTFLYVIGHLGIKGSIAVILSVTMLNCALSAALLLRILHLDLKWSFIVGFFAYSYLVFSQPYFYTFYSHDALAQLSYFFLITSAWCFSLFYKYAAKTAHALLFFLALLAFLSKETYGLSALGIAGVWFLYVWKESRLRAIMPMLMVGSALFLSFCHSFVVKSVVVASTDTALNAPYKIDVAVASVAKEWLTYAQEGLNAANVVMFVLIALACWTYFRRSDKQVIYACLACMLAAILASVPNALLPNHHFSGYSWSGAYLLFLPVLLLPIFWAKQGWGRFFSVSILVLSVMSPALNKKDYAKNEWNLAQETTQRNLLDSLNKLIGRFEPLDGSAKVLVSGLNFPFSPFVYPASLLSFPNARFVNFDVVSYSADKFGERNYRVGFIHAADINLQSYTNLWMFRPDGSLIRDIHVGKDIMPAAAFELTPSELVAFPSVTEIKNTGENGYALLTCGTELLSYKQPALALRCLEASIQKIPENPYTYFYSGLALEQLKRVDEAKLFFAKAVAHDTRGGLNSVFKNALQR